MQFVLGHTHELYILFSKYNNRLVILVIKLKISQKHTYDPGNDEHFHPRKGSCFHTKQLRWIVMNGHIWEQLCPIKAVCSVHYQKAKENSEGGCVCHKLKERPTHDLSHLLVTAFFTDCGVINKRFMHSSIVFLYITAYQPDMLINITVTHRIWWIF